MKKTKTDGKKRALLKAIEKTPVVAVACQKANIHRSTYYEWIRSDEVFAAEAKKALERGTQQMNDIAESQLLTLVKEKHFSAVMAWLKHNSPKYTTKYELKAQIKNDEALSFEQKKLLEKALKYSSLGIELEAKTLHESEPQAKTNPDTDEK